MRFSSFLASAIVFINITASSLASAEKPKAYFIPLAASSTINESMVEAIYNKLSKGFSTVSSIEVINEDGLIKSSGPAAARKFIQCGKDQSCISNRLRHTPGFSYVILGTVKDRSEKKVLVHLEIVDINSKVISKDDEEVRFSAGMILSYPDESAAAFAQALVDPVAKTLTVPDTSMTVAEPAAIPHRRQILHKTTLSH